MPNQPNLTSRERWEVYDPTRRETLASYLTEAEARAYAQACNERTARIAVMPRLVFLDDDGDHDLTTEGS